VEISALRPSGLLSAGFFAHAEPLDISSLDMGYSEVEGFSRPDWKLIGHGIRHAFEERQWPQVWRQIGIQWLDQLKADLGGDYQRYEAWNFLLLSAETKADSEAMLEIAEDAVEAIEAHLNYLTRRKPLYGKRVLLAFNEQDDYYSYLSHFYADGHHSTSAGIFLRAGYGHIALPFTKILYVKQVLIHELTHNCLFNLRIPTWLNEGLSQRMEREVDRVFATSAFASQRVVLNRELAAEHHDFWNEQNIQEFWAGTSFYRPGDGNKLSYSLGEIFVEILAEQWRDFLDFVEHADPRDAGQDASLRFLDRCLGDVAGGFLGPGQWRPNRKMIAELWERRKNERPDAPVAIWHTSAS
jgi:hypothetical protein